MWLQRFTHFLLKHRLQALLLTFFSTFIPFLGIVGILIAGFMTLVKGIVEGAIFTLASIVPYFILLFLNSQPDKMLPFGIIVAVVSNILMWIFATMWRRKTSFTIILQIAALAGVLVISLLHLVYPDISNWWGQQLQHYFTTASKLLAKNEAQIEQINASKYYATGILVSGILFAAMVQLICAKWWQVVLFKRDSLKKELHYIKLNSLAGVLFLLALISSYWGNAVISDIMPVLYLLFASAGLSLVHYLFSLMQSQTKFFWLLLIYFMLILASSTVVVLLAGLAFFDIWLDIRHRIKAV